MQISINRSSKVDLISWFIFILIGSVAVSACSQDSDLALLRDVSDVINSQHYDPDLHGIEWAEITSRYETLVASSSSQDQTLRVIDQMMQELGDSHCGLFAVSDIKRASSPYLFGEGSPGLDLRIIENQAIITQVEEGSSAEQAGLRPGFKLIAIDKQKVDATISDIPARPPHTEANRKYFQTEAILWQLFGPVGTVVDIVYLDTEDKVNTASLKRLQRSGRTELFPSLPLVVLEAKHRVLPEVIDYLTFNAFQPDQPSKILTAIQNLDIQKPLVIDLRGNNGGSVNATIQVLNHFAEKQFLAFRRVGREDEASFFVQPTSPPRKHKIVVLIDEMSVSAAENFAVIMQHNQLAKIVGAHTPGQLLWGESFALRDDVIAVVPVAQIIYPDGTSIEGQGVVPDQIVNLSRADLLNGIDSQLNAAINLLQDN